MVPELAKLLGAAESNPGCADTGTNCKARLFSPIDLGAVLGFAIIITVTMSIKIGTFVEQYNRETAMPLHKTTEVCIPPFPPSGFRLHVHRVAGGFGHSRQL
eukprot:1243614-Rhodomonas_salina.2